MFSRPDNFPVRHVTYLRTNMTSVTSIVLHFVCHCKVVCKDPILCKIYKEKNVTRTTRMPFRTNLLLF